jgi:phosphate transport system substrate-binding protein
VNWRRLVLLIAVFVLVNVAQVAPSSAAVSSLDSGTLVGAGDSLMAPLVVEWGSGFTNTTGNPVNYAATTSSTGILDAQEGIVDFAGVDYPMTAAQVSACSGCSTIPWILTAVGITFNLPGVKSVKLTGKLLAQIFTGAITNWDDRRIERINKGITLPNLAITVVTNSQPSGETEALTTYLSDVDPKWAARVGHGPMVTFPTGRAEAGDDSVITEVSSVTGSIAYVGVSALVAKNLPAAEILNRAGAYEAPDGPNIESAGLAVHSVAAPFADLSIVDPPRSLGAAYPISMFTYAIVPQPNSDAAVVKAFIELCLTTGQQYGTRLGFMPLPGVVRSFAASEANKL